MSDEPGSGGLYVDSDWKAEAAKEKEKLAEQEGASTASTSGGDVAPLFFELVNLLAMQASIGLGGYQGPSGQRIPPNPAAAKHHIDMLDELEKKTKGNLSDDEKRVLDTVLYELRMSYVQVTGAPKPSTPSSGGVGSPQP